MKTMTCKQMGGPCDFAMHANSAEDMMKMGGDHVNEMAVKGDAPHQAAKKMMDDAGTNPEMMKQWMDKFQADYAATPEDQ